MPNVVPPPSASPSVREVGEERPAVAAARGAIKVGEVILIKGGMPQVEAEG